MYVYIYIYIYINIALALTACGKEVTTCLCQDRVSCAPAAFLGRGSRFSGSLSGIEP